MTKEQEIKTLKDFIETLPGESYLHDFFAEEFSVIRETILNDGWYEVSRSMRGLRMDRDALREEIQRLVIEEKTRQDRVDQLRREGARMEAALKEIGEKASRIWSMVR